MSLIIEDGTGKSDAESYCSVADADSRHTSLGNAAWAGATGVKEAALRNATAYMEQAYRQRWCGTRLLRDQALSWPRYGAVVDDFPVQSTVVPSEVVNACADLALKALSGELAPDLERAVVRKKLGPIEKEYDRYSPQSVRYRAVDMLLAPFLKGSSATAMLVRA